MTLTKRSTHGDEFRWGRELFEKLLAWVFDTIYTSTYMTHGIVLLVAQPAIRFLIF